MTKGCFSALAGYPSWYCEYYTQKDPAATHYCCDVYENEGTPGVKWTGTWREFVRTGFFLQSVLFVNC